MNQEYKTALNKKSVVVFLCRNNMYSRLMQRELIKSDAYIVKQESIESFPKVPYFEHIKVLLIDYQTILEKNIQNVFIAETFKFNLIVYNAPPSIHDERLITWGNVKGILFEESPIEHLCLCLEAVMCGDMWLPRHMMVQLISDLRSYSLFPTQSHILIDDLTRREKQILERIVCGQSNLQIANELCVAESTIKTHIYRLYKKLNVNNRREAIQVIKHYQHPG